MFRFGILLLVGLFLTACVEEDSPSETATAEFLDGPADGLSTLQLRADGLTLWAEPVATVGQLGDTFTLDARVSHSIKNVSASVGGISVETRVVSARKFAVDMSAQALAANLTEIPLIVRLETTSGKVFHLMFGVQGRFRNTSGSSKIYVWQNILPISKGGTILLRGRVTTRGEFVDVGGSNDDDSEPEGHRESSTKWALDFWPSALPWAGSPTDDALHIWAEAADETRVRRSAEIHFEVVRLGVTSGNPDLAWPAASCGTRVLACVEDRGVMGDFEGCGKVQEVQACWETLPEDPSQPDPVLIPRFADDLRKALIAYYANHGTDVVGSGGNTLQQALVLVDEAAIEEVLDPEEDPHAHDFATTRVFRHPDVMFPGSDIVWFGAYARDTGALVSVYEYN